MAGYTSPESGSGALGRQIWGALAVLVVAGIILTLSDPVKEEVAAVIRNTALAPFTGLNSVLRDARVRGIEAEDLRQVVDSLTDQLIERRPLDEENRRLRDLLVLSERLGADWGSAEALLPGTQGSESELLLDVGEREGIRVRAPVVTREGLAGVVRERRSNDARAMDWTHPEFGAAVMSEDGLTHGIVQAARGAFREGDYLTLRGTPFNTVLDSGTVILTSGRGGVFPRGIPVGTVERVEASDGRFQRSYELRPFVDPGSITLVLVQKEIPELASALRQDSLTTATEDAEAWPTRFDVSAAWPANERLRADERARLIPLWQDTIRALRDSLAQLRGSGGGMR